MNGEGVAAAAAAKRGRRIDAARRTSAADLCRGVAWLQSRNFPILVSDRLLVKRRMRRGGKASVTGRLSFSIFRRGASRCACVCVRALFWFFCARANAHD